MLTGPPLGCDVTGLEAGAENQYSWEAWRAREVSCFQKGPPRVETLFSEPKEASEELSSKPA